MKRISVLFALFSLAACQSPTETSFRAQRALQTAGYSQIELSRPGFFDTTGCGEHDEYARMFTAVGPTGNPAAGSVCMGYWKGSTIRLD